LLPKTPKPHTLIGRLIIKCIVRCDIKIFNYGDHY